ncbi:MAG: zinc-binding dehydrogenase [Pseudomonadota bacterium]
MPTGLKLSSTVTSAGQLQLRLQKGEIPELKDSQILVKIEATPINPSDLGTLLGAADVEQGVSGSQDGLPTYDAPIISGAMAAMGSRLDIPLPIGNEGAGEVVAAGSDPAAQALIGKTVGVMGGAMYAQYRAVDVAMALPLPEGVTSRQGASNFVNPMTVLAFLETLRMEGHKALIHTAAASNLGQMLVKVCKDDGIPLVNVVRSAEHVAMLRDLGAEHVVDSSTDGFKNDLNAAIQATGATLAFDAIGGGKMADALLGAMEASLSDGDPNNRYGSTTHKQVYIYGSLAPVPTTLNRSYGMAWGVGGWLVMNTLAKVGGARAAELRTRVANEITTTFASHYSDEISLTQALDAETVKAYQRKATGRKFLINPSLN